MKALTLDHPWPPLTVLLDMRLEGKSALRITTDGDGNPHVFISRHHELAVEASKPSVCPLCGKLNNDNWPLRTDDAAGTVVFGGCQDCWEEQSGADYWRLLGAPSGAGEEEQS